jgi:hypothetical protein
VGLRGADLSTADQTGAIFNGAIYNQATRFPKGFDPNKHGMIFTEKE